MSQDGIVLVASVSILGNDIIIGEITGGKLKLEEDEITDSKWIKVNDLLAFVNEDLREPHVIKQIVDNLFEENIYSISVFNEQLFK